MKSNIKILVLSDIHRNTKVFDDILSVEKCDYSILAGDFECDDSLVNKYITYAVRGNNDWDSKFSDELDFEINGIKFHLEHGHLLGSYFQLDNYEYMHKKLLNLKCDILIHGHTHIPKIFEYEEGIIINPGSTTLPRGGSNPSYAIITINSDNSIECRIVDYIKK